MTTPSYHPSSLFREILVEGEEVRYEGRPHPIVLVGPIVWLCITSIVFLLPAIWILSVNRGSYGGYYTSPNYTPVMFLGLLWLLVGLLPFIIAVLKWMHTLYGVSNRRIVFQRGVIGRSRDVAPFDKIQNINFNQGWLERFVGCGTLKFDTAGTTFKGIRWHAVRDPQGVQKLVAEVMEREGKRRKTEEFREMARIFKESGASTEAASSRKIKVRLKAEPEAINKKVYEYIRRGRGEIDISECAEELDISEDDVEKAIESLKKKGKLEE